MKADFEKGTKICSKCKRELPIEMFTKTKWSSDGLYVHCKDCLKIENKQRYDKSREGKPNLKRKRIITEDNLLQCSKCKKMLPLSMFHKDSYQLCGYDHWCKDCRRKYQKVYSQTEAGKQANKRGSAKFRASEEGKAYIKAYKESGKACRGVKKYWRNGGKEKSLKRRQERWQNDIEFKLVEVTRNRMRSMVVKGYKSAHTMELIGCTPEKLKKWLEAQFDEGMTWENFGKGEGKWNIDHIIPCAKFDLTKENHQKVCFNYRNLRPLWEKENIQKRDILPEDWEGLLKVISEELRVEAPVFP